MSHDNNMPSRPEDLNCCFWNMLLLLAREPAFEALREALSRGNAAPGGREKATRPGNLPLVAVPHRADPSVVEALEAGQDAAALPGNTRSAAGLPRAGETRENPNRLPGGQSVPENPAPYDFPPCSVGLWSIQALRLVERSGHPRIWKVYNSGLMLFIAFQERVRLPSVWPIPEHHIRGFLLSLDSQGVSVPKTFTYLSGLSYISRMFNYQDPLQDLFTFHLMSGMQWQRFPPVPLSLETLESLMGALERVCPSFYECLLYRAAFLLSFFGALRPQEIVAVNSRTLHPELLCLNDIEMQPHSIGLNLYMPEMSQGRVTFWLGLSEKPWVCPVLALKNYLAVRPHGEGPLFLYSNRHLLNKNQFLKTFHAALRRVDLPPERYGMQSFWLGSITNAVRYHYPEKVILYLARWPCRQFP